MPATRLLWDLAYTMDLVDSRMLWCAAPPQTEPTCGAASDPQRDASLCACSLPVRGQILRPSLSFSCERCALRANVAVPVSFGKPAGCRWYIIAVTEQFVHRRVADERYINAVQELEALVGASPRSSFSRVLWRVPFRFPVSAKNRIACVNHSERLSVLPFATGPASSQK